MNLIDRQAAIDVLSLGKEILSRVLDDMDVVGTDREKYSWGLGLIETNIEDIKELPSAQQEITYCKDCKHMITHEGYGYLGEPAYTCEGNMEGWVLPDSFCSNAERKDGD